MTWWNIVVVVVVVVGEVPLYVSVKRVKVNMVWVLN